MGTERPRFSITVSEDMYSDINEYQHSNRISTQTKAIAQILQIGLDALENPRRMQPKKSPAPAEPETRENVLLQKVTDCFNQLNTEGQERLAETADDMVQSGKYIKSDKVKVAEDV